MMEDSAKAVENLRIAYEELHREAGEAKALEVLEDLRSEARDAQFRGVDFVADEVEEPDELVFDEDGEPTHGPLGDDVGGVVKVIDEEDGHLVLNGDTYEAKDQIKEVDYQYRDFDGDRKVWLVDREAAEVLHEALNTAGFLLEDHRDEDVVPRAIRRERELEALGEIVRGVEEGDRVRVEYAQKNGEGHNGKEGVVTRKALPDDEFRDEPQLVFVRDDEQRMYVEVDKFGKLGLWTSMSHAPFVGEVEEIEVA